MMIEMLIKIDDTIGSCLLLSCISSQLLMMIFISDHLSLLNHSVKHLLIFCRYLLPTNMRHHPVLKGCFRARTFKKPTYDSFT